MEDNQSKTIEDQLREENEILRTQLREATARIKRMLDLRRRGKGWAFDYLVEEVSKLEKLNSDQQDIINSYVRHFAKYGKFYQDLQRKLSTKPKRNYSKKQGIIELHDQTLHQ